MHRLLMVHATGFCAAVFRPIIDWLGADFDCTAIDLRGHGASPAVDPGETFAWEGFAADVLAAAATAGTPIAAVGHSSGGAALLLAEAERPGTFSALWLYEPIVWPDPIGARPRAERLAAGAARRRPSFGSRDEAFDNFASKPPFSALDRAALRAYVECGFDDAGSLRLRPEQEAAIYLQGVVGDRFARLGEVACPVVVAAGGSSDAIHPERAAEIAAALPAGRLRVFDGLGHFGPLEDPAAVAGAIAADLTADLS